MKLVVKRIDTPTVPGGLAYVLCDEAGEILPNQRRCNVDTGIDRGIVTVELYIDGDTVSLT